MSAYIWSTVCNCHQCARNRLRLHTNTNSLKLFPTKEPLQSLGIDLLGPLTKTKHRNQFLLVTTGCFSKLTSVVPLRRTDAYTVSVSLTVLWVRHHGPSGSLISDNVAHFAANFFQNVSTLLDIANIYTSTYHPESNGQVEKHNCTMLAMFRSYVCELQDDWDEYVSPLTYGVTIMFITVQGGRHSL